MADVTYIAAQSRPTQGALLMATAVLLFACMDVTTKHMALAYAVPLIVFMRYAGNFFLLLAIFGPGKGKSLFATQRTGLVLLRAACLACSSLFAALAFQRMPVAETIAILFVAPFGVMLLAGPLLGEKACPLQWAAACLGFAGVLLVARPGSGLDPVGVMFALMAAGGGIVYNTLSRTLARSETTESMLVWTAFVGMIAFGAALPWSLPAQMPSTLDLLAFAALGILSTAGHFMFTQACRLAPASVIAPVNYLQLVWSGILGFLVFGHVPDHLGLMGMGLIALGGMSAAIWPMIAPRPALRAEVC